MIGNEYNMLMAQIMGDIEWGDLSEHEVPKRELRNLRERYSDGCGCQARVLSWGVYAVH